MIVSAVLRIMDKLNIAIDMCFMAIGMCLCLGWYVLGLELFETTTNVLEHIPTKQGHFYTISPVLLPLLFLTVVVM